MNTQLAIQENGLELIVSEKTLGSLTTNAMQIRDMVQNALPKYDISNYNESNIGQAKKDKAALNKAAKDLNAKRLVIEREFTKPFAEFKEVINETVKLISECSSKIDNVIKQNDTIYRDEKLQLIKTYFDEFNISLVDFEKIYKESWMNKSVKMKGVCSEIDSILKKVEDDLSSIETLAEDSDILKTLYMDILDLNKTLDYGARLRLNREQARIAEENKRVAAEAKHKADEEAKARRLAQPKVNPLPPVRSVFPQRTQSVFEAVDPVSETKKEITPIAEAAPIETEQLLTRAFKVTTSRENIIALGDFMNERGIDFDKIDL